MIEPRLALIGCGGIADFHVPACREAGFRVTAVCSRPESTRIAAFSQRHGIPLVFNDVRRLMAARNEWDALLIAAPADVTLGVLNLALESGAPVLVEKPVALRASALLPLLGRRLPVIVGYNRRFYRTVQEAKREAEAGRPVLAHLSIPESVSAPAVPLKDQTYLNPFFSNSVHGLDLARYVFGNLRVDSVCQIVRPSGAIQGIAATLRTEDGSVVQFTGNWGVPANFRLTIERPGRRFELCPFESSAIYEGMEVREPSEGAPIRTYTPRLIASTGLPEEDRRFKPGFVGQARAFAALVHGQDARPAATLEDAHAALELAERLVYDERSLRE
ncbi:MAG: Gfo/Idh/MocA family oxidoreductase [Chloroflexi bacterium]|nr:Gfo/Idh/MocA family oxidoreductase [Chloroflexota bacterium]